MNACGVVIHAFSESILTFRRRENNFLFLFIYCSGLREANRFVLSEDVCLRRNRKLSEQKSSLFWSEERFRIKLSNFNDPITDLGHKWVHGLDRRRPEKSENEIKILSSGSSTKSSAL